MDMDMVTARAGICPGLPDALGPFLTLLGDTVCCPYKAISCNLSKARHCLIYPSCEVPGFWFRPGLLHAWLAADCSLYTKRLFYSP